MSEVPAPRRRRLIALLQSCNDWINVPGARSPAGDGEQSMAGDGAESEVERQDRKQRERRYRERVEADIDQAAGVERPQRTRNEAAYRAHMASGSYRELDVAMRHLKRRKPYSWWLLDRIYVQQVMTPVQDYRLDAAFRELSDLMPDLLRVPLWLDPPEPDDRVERDRRIAAWAAAGRSTRWIAGRAGVTQPRVVQILNRQRKDLDAAA